MGRPSRARKLEEDDRPTEAARNATDLDRVIHERLRLGIVSALASRDTLSFNDLKASHSIRARSETTPGSLPPDGTTIAS